MANITSFSYVGDNEYISKFYLLYSYDYDIVCPQFDNNLHEASYNYNIFDKEHYISLLFNFSTSIPSESATKIIIRINSKYNNTELETKILNSININNFSITKEKEYQITNDIISHVADEENIFQLNIKQVFQNKNTTNNKILIPKDFFEYILQVEYENDTKWYKFVCTDEYFKLNSRENNDKLIIHLLPDKSKYRAIYDSKNDIYYTNIKTFIGDNAVFNIYLYDRNSQNSGPLLALKNYGYDTFEKVYNILVTSAANPYLIPSNKNEHQFINAEDIDWMGAEIIVNDKIYVINSLDDLINFIEDSYNSSNINMSEYLTKDDFGTPTRPNIVIPDYTNNYESFVSQFNNLKNLYNPDKNISSEIPLYVQPNIVLNKLATTVINAYSSYNIDSYTWNINDTNIASIVTNNSNNIVIKGETVGTTTMTVSINYNNEIITATSYIKVKDQS